MMMIKEKAAREMCSLENVLIFWAFQQLLAEDPDGKPLKAAASIHLQNLAARDISVS